VAAAAQRYGYQSYYTDWRRLLEDDRVELFDNGGSNAAHAEPCIAAAEAGKHVICEKRWRSARRRCKCWMPWCKPASSTWSLSTIASCRIRQAYNFIQSGALGRLYHFRAVYLQEWIMPHYNVPRIWRLQKSLAGTGALGDLGAHIIDLSRFLMGEVKRRECPHAHLCPGAPSAGWQRAGQVDVDDAFATLVEFENGAMGTLEAHALPRSKNHLCSRSTRKRDRSLQLERLNELEHSGGRRTQRTRAFTTSGHRDFSPVLQNWWPHGTSSVGSTPSSTS